MRPSRQTFTTVLLALAVTVPVACGGGGGDVSIGNAQTWCPTAGVFIDALEEATKLMRNDARMSQIADASYAYQSAERDIEELIPRVDFSSSQALEDLFDWGDELNSAYLGHDSRDAGDIERAQVAWDKAKQRVQQICSS